MRLRRRNDRERGSIALVAVLGLMALALGLALVTLTANSANVKHVGQAREDVDLHFIAMAALNRAYAEVEASADLSGDGHIGGLDVSTYTDLSGAAKAEYCAYVVNLADNDPGDDDEDDDGKKDAPIYVIRAVVGVPSLASPRYGRVAEARILALPSVAFKPKVGAVSIAGPMSGNPDLSGWNSTAFSIAGGSFPGVVFTDQSSHDNFVKDSTITSWGANGLGSKVTGSPMNEIDHNGDGNKDFDAPFVVQPDAAFTADMLNDYRDALRAYVHQDLLVATESGGSVTVDYTATASKGVVVLHQNTAYVDDVHPNAGLQPKLKPGTLTFNNQTVLLDSSQFYQGGSSLVQTHADGTGGPPGVGATTISGSGTLVILHPVGSFSDNANGKMFNLDWDGDVFVIGYDKDTGTGNGVGSNAPTDNLLYLSRANWNVDGNLVLVTNGAMEPSLEARGDNTQAGLTVNGSLIMLGEAKTHEVDLEMEAKASLTVNGILSVFGKRVELENTNGGTGTNFQVNGTLAIGFPGSVDANGDGDFNDTAQGDFNAASNSFTWRVSGNADFNFNQGNVEDAITKLARLQSNLDLSSTNIVSLDFEQRSTLARSTITAAQGWAARQAAVAAGSAGIDPNLIKETLE